jgi:HAE1 family hydrophobic/amphiphilic exporter-1
LFDEIVVATDDDGRVTRIRDIARVELGSQDYRSNAYLDNQVATAIGICVPSFLYSMKFWHPS